MALAFLRGWGASKPFLEHLRAVRAFMRGDRARGVRHLELARDAAPRAPVDLPRSPTFVSRRVGCVVLRPDLDLTAVCLKE